MYRKTPCLFSTDKHKDVFSQRLKISCFRGFSLSFFLFQIKTTITQWLDCVCNDRRKNEKFWKDTFACFAPINLGPINKGRKRACPINLKWKKADGQRSADWKIDVQFYKKKSIFNKNFFFAVCWRWTLHFMGEERWKYVKMCAV